MFLLGLFLSACASPAADCAGAAPVGEDPGEEATDPGETTGGTTPPAGAVVLRGATLLEAGDLTGQVADVRLEGGRIVAVGAVDTAGAEVIDVTGRFLAPAFIDSHVHLAYLPESGEMLDRGVAAAVDLASPLAFLKEDLGPLRLIRSGPMITAVGGYPTQSWGSNGYGLECEDDPADTAAAAKSLVAAGAGVIKLPITSGPVLSADALQAAADAAHAAGVKAVSHALGASDAALAAQIGADALAHTPTSALSESAIAAWNGRAVISTLAAFGGSDAAVDNLRALRAAGAIVLYGTDFGNLRDAGISASEIALLEEAGLSGAEILASGTSAPAAWWGLADLGSIGVGQAASLIVLAEDPRAEPSALASPEQVWIAGARR